MGNPSQNSLSGIVFMKVQRASQPDLLPDRDSKMASEETSIDEQLALIDKKIDIKIKVSVGDVYLVKIPKGIGSELEGDHFVVAVFNSGIDNPNVIVVPLTSLKEKKRNPAHSVYLGKIKGIDNGKESVALLNQVMRMDKKRFLNAKDVEYISSKINAESSNEGEEVCQICKTHYRLSDRQLNHLLTMAMLYYKRNSQNGWNEKLVDF